MKYQPSIKLNNQIDIPFELMKLRELIAENVHDAWAAERIADGWVYGKERDDKKKTHPSLIPYHELSEEEKKYDRITSETTIRAILSNGYKITK